VRVFSDFQEVRYGAEAICSVGGRFIAWRRQVRSELGKVVDGCASRRLEAARTTGLAGVESRVQEAVVAKGEGVQFVHFLWYCTYYVHGRATGAVGLFARMHAYRVGCFLKPI
jgi:hypothetical protein